MSGIKTKLLLSLVMISLNHCILTWGNLQMMKSKDASIEIAPKNVMGITVSENKIFAKVKFLETSTDDTDRYFDRKHELCFLLPEKQKTYPYQLSVPDAVPCPDPFPGNHFQSLEKTHALLFVKDSLILKSPDNYDIFCECKNFPLEKEIKNILVGKGIFEGIFFVQFQDGTAYKFYSQTHYSFWERKEEKKEGIFSQIEIEEYLNSTSCKHFKQGLCGKEYNNPDLGDKVADYFPSQNIVQVDPDMGLLSVMYTDSQFYIAKVKGRSDITGKYYSFSRKNSPLKHSISYIEIIPDAKPYKSRTKYERVLFIPVFLVGDILTSPFQLIYILIALSR
ncbi:hypothetical protein JWG40_02555 [Leptospira sp. 201903074]|uniref:hypothetical protein n=1 Tax=Leptospira abararensis TaxID=2810036 RepID=UPI001963C1CF|nr:hypothetical protein [Leptospira abararensis]MBM9545882.1 hypothetical protein [Leptospira abararensis]